jgi:hypothetical protein
MITAGTAASVTCTAAVASVMPSWFIAPPP